MDKLTHIIHTFDKYKMPHIDVLNNKDSKSQHTKLYRAILDGKVKTDDEAAKFLFGPDAKKGDQKYRNFKTEFKKRLLNTMLFIDPSHEDFDSYQKVVYELNLEWMTIRAMGRSGMSDTALSLAKKILETAIEYDYTDLTIQIIDLLKHSTAMTGDIKHYAEYQQLHNHYIGLWLWEQKAKEYSDLLRMEFVKTARYKGYLSDVAKGYFEELTFALEKYNSITLCLNIYMVEIYIYSTICDYKNMLDVAEQGLTFCQSKPFEARTAISIFTHQKMTALMMLEYYSEAEKMVEETIALRVKGSFNWFKAQESKAFLLFKMHRFTEGYALYAEIIKMPEFKALPEGMSKEMWFLFNAYFHILHHLGKISLSTFEKKDKVLKNPKFLNDLPTFYKDKQGMNLVVLSVKICFWVVTKQYDDLIKHLESIDKYFDRYAKKDDPYYRFHQFGSLLLEIPKSNFNHAFTKQNTIELRKKLKSIPFDQVESALRGEAIQLEKLWDWTLETLEG